jgi:hypothetical protein
MCAAAIDAILMSDMVAARVAIRVAAVLSGQQRGICI